MIELTVNTSELFEVVKQINDDGFDTVKISVEEAYDEMPAAIDFSCIDTKRGCEIGYETVFAEEE